MAPNSGIAPEILDDTEMSAEEGRDMTKRFEGWDSNPYKDTKGNPTIGYGFNISEYEGLIPKDVLSGTRGLTQEEGNFIFEQAYRIAGEDAERYLGDTYDKLALGVTDIITDMSYNMGYPKLSGFKKLKKALQEDDYAKAAAEMKDSKWYGQVGNRSKELVEKMKGFKKEAPDTLTDEEIE